MSPLLDELVSRYPELAECKASIEQAYALLHATYAAGGKLLVCGNGGSAADAEHLAGELLKGFRQRRPLPAKWRKRLGNDLADQLQGALPTLPLPSWVSLNTAFANDCDPDYTFAQLTWGLGCAGDALLAISTSGNAANVCHAIRVAQAKRLKTIGLTGRCGGKLKAGVDVCVCVPEEDVYKIQERHLPIYHTWSLMLEEAFFG